MDTKLVVKDVFSDIKIEKQFKVLDRIVNVPTKYFGNVFMGAFTISTKKTRDIITTNKLIPVEISPGRSIVALTVFKNHETPVGPYKEIVVSIPVLYDTKITFPFLPFLFRKMLKNFGFYVLLIASDTDLSREEGNIIFGYPHYENNIDINFEGTDLYFYAKLKEKNQNILSLKVDKVKNEKIEKNDYQTYFVKNNILFRIKMNSIAIVGRSLNNKGGILELYNHPITNILKELQININPIELSYYRNAIEILNLPDEIRKEWF